MYYITKKEHLYPLKHTIGTALSISLSSVYSYFKKTVICCISVVRITSTQCAGENAYPYAQKTDLPSHGNDGEEGMRRPCRIALSYIGVLLA